MTTQPLQNNRIFWMQVFSLIALDLAILISWMAYHEYQPVLIGLFKFEKQVLPLLLMQGIILLVTPPIAGYLTDRMRQKRGVRLPVVNLGINFVAMVFMSVAFTVFMEPSGWIVNAFPVLIALWLIAMNIFHSPAISTVELFVPPSRLPQVMVIFAITADLCQAIEPSVQDIIQTLGAPVTFASGGVLVFATGYWFMRTVKKMDARPVSETHAASSETTSSNFGIVLLAGLLLGCAVCLFFNVFPAWAAMKVSWLGEHGISGNLFISLLAIGAALSAVLTGKLSEKYAAQTLLYTGAVLCTVCALVAWYGTGAVSLAGFIGFAMSVSLVSVCALPVALGNLSAAQKVFGVGLFFSLVQLPESVLNVWLAS